MKDEGEAGKRRREEWEEEPGGGNAGQYVT